MNEPQKYDAKLKMADAKEHRVHDSIHMKCPENSKLQ